MLDHSIYAQSKQGQICRYLSKHSQKNLTAEQAQANFRSDVYNQFAIGDKIGNAQYKHDHFYQLFFTDISLLEVYPELSPTIVFKKGILSVSAKGNLTILDEHYNLLDTNSSFSFINNQLHLNINERLIEQNASSYMMR